MKKKYNWSEIQKYYDEGNTWIDIKNKFGCCIAAIDKAKKRGDFISRNMSEAIIIAYKKYPEKFLKTDETKKKISESRKKYLEENPDKVPYLLNHYSKGPSYPEKYFMEVFDNEQIDLKYHKQIKYYQLDFYNEGKKVDVEIDGEQHYLDGRITKSDEKRNQYLEDLGWIVFRIRWSDYQKLPYKEKQKVIKEIKKILES